MGPQQFMTGTGEFTDMFPKGSWEKRWVESQEKVWRFVQARQKEIACRMKERYDINRKELELEPGDLVLLSTKSHHLLKGCRKQQERYVGPYVVQHKIHPNAYKLSGLPERVPPTQNVRFLLKYQRSPDRFRTRPEHNTSVPDLIDRQYEWEVERVEAHKDTQGRTKYLI